MCLLAAPLFLAAQADNTSSGRSEPARQQPRGPSESIRVEVELVLVPVTVTDPYNRLVTGLEQEHFRLYEDKVEQEVRYFSSEDVPISVGLVLDLSGSMSNKVDKVRQAAIRFLRMANPRDEFMLVTFKDRAQLATNFTRSITDVQDRLLYTAKPKGRTALLDGIYLALNKLDRAQHSRKALLIISDGGDNHSRYNERDIKEMVKEMDVQIYAIGIYEPIWSRSRTPEELAGPTLLSEITEITGGRTFVVENLNDIPDIAGKISIELRNQYMLGYKPSNNERDGKWRKIKIKLRPPKGLPHLQVYSRSGYYGPGGD